jgi:hypothetical protein
MKGRVKSYDANTGTVLIRAYGEVVPSASVSNTGAMDAMANAGNYLSESTNDVSEEKEEIYSFIVPEQQKYQMSIKPEMDVDFDVVSEGSKEVKSMRF